MLPHAREPYPPGEDETHVTLPGAVGWGLCSGQGPPGLTCCRLGGCGLAEPGAPPHGPRAATGNTFSDNSENVVH